MSDVLKTRKYCRKYDLVLFFRVFKNRQAMGDKTSAGSVLDCPIKVGGESTVFSTLLVLYSQLNYCVSCYAGFDGWW